jgi:hypothetical protein
MESKVLLNLRLSISPGYYSETFQTVFKLGSNRASLLSSRANFGHDNHETEKGGGTSV